MSLHFAEQGEPGMDLAEGKRYDNEQLARYERIRQADLAFDAEVGDLTTEEWYQVQQRAVGLRIELVQQQAREVCDDEDPLACAQAWAQANQAVEGLVREAALQPQTVYTPPEPRGEACLPSEVAYYMQQVEAVDAAYEGLMAEGQAAPERLTALAESMAAVGQEAAAWGCGGVAAEAQLRARDIAEAARYAQEAQFMIAEWGPSPGTRFSLPDFFGVRIERTWTVGPLMVDWNADLLLFPETGEIAFFVSPPAIDFSYENKPVSLDIGTSGTAGIVWGQGQKPEDYAGSAWVQGIHTPPMLLPVGEAVIPVPGIEFERAMSSTATAFYLGFTNEPTEAAIYEMPSYSHLLFKFRLWDGAKE